MCRRKWKALCVYVYMQCSFIELMVAFWCLILLLCCAWVFALLHACNAVIRSLLVVRSSNCCIAASSTESMVASFKTSAVKEAVAETGCCSALASYQGTLFPPPTWPGYEASSAPAQFMCTDYYWVHLITLCRFHPHRAHTHVVLSHKTPLQQQFYKE